MKTVVKKRGTFHVLLYSAVPTCTLGFVYSWAFSNYISCIVEFWTIVEFITRSAVIQITSTFSLSVTVPSLPEEKHLWKFNSPIKTVDCQTQLLLYTYWLDFSLTQDNWRCSLPSMPLHTKLCSSFSLLAHCRLHAVTSCLLEHQTEWIIIAESIVLHVDD